ncbi:MAG: class I SAM-dependent methyltransferase [Devosia sp.]
MSSRLSADPMAPSSQLAAPGAIASVPAASAAGPAGITSPVRGDKRALFDNLFDTFRTHVSDDTSAMSLLDLGCGPDGYVTLYAEHFGPCYGVDLFDYASNYEAITYLKSDGLQIPIRSNSIDCVVSHSTLEHVTDLSATMAEINRVLRVQGIAYLTVSPLYFAAAGGHDRRAPPWGHLDPDGPFYIPKDREVATGRHLNRLTNAMFLSAVGQQPWQIISHEIRPAHDRVPPALAQAYPMMDLATREFRFIGRKRFDPGKWLERETRYAQA